MSNWLAKAWAIFKKSPVQFFFSEAEAIVSVIRCTWCMVKCLGRKTNWMSGIIWYLCSILFKYFTSHVQVLSPGELVY